MNQRRAPRSRRLSVSCASGSSASSGNGYTELTLISHRTSLEHRIDSRAVAAVFDRVDPNQDSATREQLRAHLVIELIGIRSELDVDAGATQGLSDERRDHPGEEGDSGCGSV